MNCSATCRSKEKQAQACDAGVCVLPRQVGVLSQAVNRAISKGGGTRLDKFGLIGRLG